MTQEKTINLSELTERINKKFGSNKLMVIGSEPIEKHPTISSGSISLNYALNGGYAKGRMIEVFGDNGSGKTTLALHAIAEAQKLGEISAFIDMEHALNLEYAEEIGVDVPNLIFSQPDHGEEALALIEELIISKIVRFICIDSVAAMVPKAELEGEFGESKMGLHARMMSQGMRKLTGLSSKNNVTLFFINQTRFKIGIMFGDPTTTTGGEALKFYTSQRLHTIASTKTKDSTEEVTGQEIIVKVIKNKIGIPHRKIKFNLIYGKGIDNLLEVIELALDMDILVKKGSFYSYGEHKLGQGINNLRNTLEDNPELLQEIKTKVGV